MTEERKKERKRRVQISKDVLNKDVGSFGRRVSEAFLGEEEMEGLGKLFMISLIIFVIALCVWGITGSKVRKKQVNSKISNPENSINRGKDLYIDTWDALFSEKIRKINQKIQKTLKYR